MGTLVPLRFERFWKDPKLNDITVRILGKPAALLPDAQRQQSKRRRVNDSAETKHVVPCCKVMLAAGSEYFRTWLSSDLEDGANDFFLVVEEGESDAALAVVQTMYTGIPEGVSAAKLVTMWKIADQLQATSATIYIEALCSVELDWETALMVRGRMELIDRLHMFFFS